MPKTLAELATQLADATDRIHAMEQAARPSLFALAELVILREKRKTLAAMMRWRAAQDRASAEWLVR
jgi:hypothetical protein